MEIKTVEGARSCRIRAEEVEVSCEAGGLVLTASDEAGDHVEMAMDFLQLVDVLADSDFPILVDGRTPYAVCWDPEHDCLGVFTGPPAKNSG